MGKSGLLRHPLAAYRFGPFEVDVHRSQLRKSGVRLRLERKPLQLLLALLERPGELVSRGELESRLWAEGVFVDFEHGLNVAVKKVRDILGDSAAEPRYIETVAGEGYRFIAPVEVVETAPPACEPVAAPQPEPAPPVDAVDTSAVFPRRHAGFRRLAWAVAAAMVLLAACGWLAWRALHSHPPLLSSQGWVLVAGFENRTGERRLDGALEYALERELSNSRFVQVVSREQVDDVLRLMQKPADSRIDAVLGREICLRDGDIQLLIAGRAEKLGSTYMLSADIVNPATGVRVASLSEEAAGDGKLAAAVRRLSDRVRERIGEAPAVVQASQERLEKVTTISLHGLQLYTLADRVIARTRDGNVQAAEILEEALREDPQFASAHTLLGYAYENIGEREKAMPHFRRALELADSTAARERFFITGSYYEAANQREKAVAAYEALLRLYPDHYWGNHNLADLYARLGRLHEASGLWVRIAKLRPNDLHSNRMAADWLTSESQAGRGYLPSGDAAARQAWSAAQSFTTRSLQLLQMEGDGAEPTDADQLRALLVKQDELKGDIARAQADLLRADRENKTGAAPLGVYFFSFGQLRQAERRAASPSLLLAPALAFYKGDFRRAKQLLLASGEGGDVAACLLIRMGMLREAETLCRTSTAPDSPRFSERLLQIVMGQLALAKGETAKGIALLESSLPKLEGSTSGYLGYEALAAAYRRQGKLNDAARVLERGSAFRWRNNLSPPFQMRVQLQLSEVYRSLGRVADAARVENDLRNELAFADADHPMLRALARPPH